jgi:ADP-heptose:LPS heptosyltransferase
MMFLSKLLKAKNFSARADKTALLAIIDFSYQHYALGDLLTTQVHLATTAIERGLKHIDIVVIVNPKFPSTRYQPFITSANYVTHLDNIMAVFTCNPMLRSLQILRDVGTFNLIVLSCHLAGTPMWPDLETHLAMRQDYPVSHHRLNSFYEHRGYLPELRAPHDLEDWAREFHRTELDGRPFAVINPRQSSLTDSPAVTYRDAPLDEWYRFIDAVGARQPQFLFVMVGGFQEWEHRLLHRRNVFVPRANGLTLAHELALMKIADLFMGTSSGFATFATFTAIPYAILNVQRDFARYAGVKPADRHYPFARANQILTWQRETTEELLALFDEILAKSEHQGGRLGRRPLQLDQANRRTALTQ